MRKLIKLYTVVVFILLTIFGNPAVLAEDRDSVLDLVRESLWHDGVYVSKNNNLSQGTRSGMKYPEELILPIIKEVYLSK